MLANLQGTGVLAIAGTGNVVVGPNVAVTGALTGEIEALGSTALLQVAGNYFIDGMTGPELSYLGAPVTAGQFGAWVPIAVEPLADGYEVAWKRGADQYVLWIVDGDGNWLSQGAVLSGTSPALRSLESGFHHDLNGDGSIAPTIVIEASGSTVLESVANVYLLPPADGSLGPQLSYNGALVTPGQFGGWTPIAAERTPSGYEVVLKMGVDHYILWEVDSDGHWLSRSAVLWGRAPPCNRSSPVSTRTSTATARSHRRR